MLTDINDEDWTQCRGKSTFDDQLYYNEGQ